MDCPDCIVLRAELDRLRAERRQDQMEDAHAYMLLAGRLCLSLNEAWAIHVMYKAGGLPVSPEALFDGRPARNAVARPPSQSIHYTPRTLPHVYIHRLRSKLGADKIMTFPRGSYGLSPEGMAMVERALQQQAA